MKRGLHLFNEESGRLHSVWSPIRLQPRVYCGQCLYSHRLAFVQVLKDDRMGVTPPVRTYLDS